MLKLFIAVCLFVYITGQNQQPSIRADHCKADADCPDCVHGMVKFCNTMHFCDCKTHHAIRSTCKGDKDCDSGCPSGQNGVCNSQHQCECGDHATVGKRAAIRSTCKGDKDCDSGCPSGQNGVCNSQHQCECGDHATVGKRAGETCTTVADCTTTCDHGLTLKCEKPNDHHVGHCHCAN